MLVKMLCLENKLCLKEQGEELEMLSVFVQRCHVEEPVLLRAVTKDPSD